MAGKGYSSDLLIVVPARGGSKRLPRKNVRALAGRSLLERTQDAVEQAGLAAPCLLTTDDEEIGEIGRRLGWLVPFRRPASLAADTTPTLPVVMHALDWFAGDRGKDPLQVMILQVTSPFRGSACLHESIQLLADRSDADAVIGVRQLGIGSSYLFARKENGFLGPLRENEESRQVYEPNGAVYLIRTAALRSQQTLFPASTLPLVMDEMSSLDIDSELDWKLAEAWLNQKADQAVTGRPVNRLG